MNDLLLKDECYAIRGAIYEVYRELGCGFLEAVYQECLVKEFEQRNIPFIAQSELSLAYKGEPLIQKYKLDFLCYQSVIVEIKAVGKLLDEHRGQLINYLKAGNFPVGLLANFGSYPKADIVRLVNAPEFDFRQQ